MNITIRRSERRRQAAIEIHPDLSVILSVPERYPESKIEALIQKKKNWIEKKLKLFQSLGPRPVPKQFVTGESFLYLGESYQLEVIRGQRAPICLRDQKIIAQLAHRDDLRKRMIRWYRDQALEFFKTRVTFYSERMTLTPTRVVIKDYRARWGACRSTGEVFFNWRLMLAPVDIIDYVVVHELAHLKVRNHSKHFWDTVQAGFPEYKTSKERLRRMDYQGLLSF